MAFSLRSGKLLSFQGRGLSGSLLHEKTSIGTAMTASVLRAATIEAWEEFLATGLYASTEEVEVWLASWGTESELHAPMCHS